MAVTLDTFGCYRQKRYWLRLYFWSQSPIRLLIYSIYCVLLLSLKKQFNLNALSLLCFRHVLLVMFITFSWVVRTQLACVSPLRTTFKRFEHIDHASNQVDCCSNFQICLICSFFFLSPTFIQHFWNVQHRVCLSVRPTWTKKIYKKI